MFNPQFSIIRQAHDADSRGSEQDRTIRNPESNGFTLVEIVVTIVIIGIISGIAAMIILQGVKVYSAEQSRGAAHYQSRLAVERMAREARRIRSCADIAGPANPSGTLSFTDIDGNAVIFSVAGGNITMDGNLLASGVTSAQPFSFLDAGGNPTTACPGIWFVSIDVTDTQGPEVLHVSTRVYPRNF